MEAKHRQELNMLDTVQGKILASTVLAAELSPVNEALRFAAFGWAQYKTGDPMIASAVFAGSTLAVEGTAALVTAEVLDTEKSKGLMGRVNERLSKMKLDRVRTNPAAEAGIAMLGGSAVTMLVKQQQSPERTKEQNRKYGLKVAVGISAVCAAQGYAVSEGISSPSVETVGVAVAALGGVVAGASWLKNRIKNPDAEVIKEEAVTSSELVSELDRSSLEFYEKAISAQTVGPQLEGFSPDDLVKVFNDPETIWFSVEQGGEKYDWPLLTPVENFSEYVQKYFDEKYGVDSKLLYLSLPPEENTDLTAFADTLSEHVDSNTRLVVDYESSANSMQYLSKVAAKVGFNLEIDEMTDPKNGTAASVYHYEGLARIQPDEKPRSFSDLREAYADLIADGSYVGDSQLIDVTKVDERLESGASLRDRLWDIYKEQFSQLIENHPARQAQFEHEFDAMLRDPGTLTVAHFVEGDVVSFASFVGNIDACDWLNMEFYKKRFQDETVLYFPGIATDSKKQGNNYSMELINLTAQVMARAKIQPRIVFQCTNISADYIPLIVGSAIEATGRGDISISEMAKYNYRTIRMTEKG